MAKKIRKKKKVMFYVKKGEFERIDYSDGTRTVTMSPEMEEMLKEQEKRFIEKFGREPKPDEPIFFDPDADTPQPYSEKKFNEILVEALREKEILDLTKDNVDLKSRLIHVTHTKNWEVRDVPMNQKLTKVLKNIIKKIIAVPMYLLAGQEDQLGLKRFRFHDLRHTWCSRMCELGVSCDE